VKSVVLSPTLFYRFSWAIFSETDSVEVKVEKGMHHACDDIEREVE